MSSKATIIALAALFVGGPALSAQNVPEIPTAQQAKKLPRVIKTVVYIFHENIFNCKPSINSQRPFFAGGKSFADRITPVYRHQPAAHFIGGRVQ